MAQTPEITAATNAAAEFEAVEREAASTGTWMTTTARMIGAALKGTTASGKKRKAGTTKS